MRTHTQESYQVETPYTVCLNVRYCVRCPSRNGNLPSAIIRLAMRAARREKPLPGAMPPTPWPATSAVSAHPIQQENKQEDSCNSRGRGRGSDGVCNSAMRTVVGGCVSAVRLTSTPKMRPPGGSTLRGWNRLQNCSRPQYAEATKKHLLVFAYICR